MAIAPGRNLLHYRITEKLGAGGMGVVWKGVDTNLDRDVAIKVLPESPLGTGEEMLARFEREAKLLASLNHPNIASVYGMHEVDGQRFIAMELVAGEDLADRLKRGPLALDDALKIADQVAAALAAAHDSGVIHRDLKPANVMLTPEGRIKVLDFGLAKALTGEPASSSSAASLSMSPTMASSGTQAGMILGTAAYMSPEQARGKPVDRRADIWALGCLTYEMLTGRAAFGGETVTDTLAAVVRAEPDWKALPAVTPPSIHRTLRRALQKDPDRRLRDAGDIRLEIYEALSGTTAAAAETSPHPPSSRRWNGLLWAVAGAAPALLAAMLWFSPPSAEPELPLRFEVHGARGDQAISSTSLAVSPDGRRIAWVVTDGVNSSIRMRDLQSLQITDLPDTEGVTPRLTFSPDGKSVAFFARGKLRRLDVGDRTAIDLCDAIAGAGISWGNDDTIIFNDGWITPLTRIAAAGGTPQAATQLDEADGEIGHWFPQLLPGNRHVLLSRWRTVLNDMSVAVASLDDGVVRDIVPRAAFARFVPPDKLLFTRSGAIHVTQFDTERMAVEGEPRLLLDGVHQFWANGGSTWTISDNGVLAYLEGSIWTTKRTIVRLARDGSESPLPLEPGGYMNAVISPDGRRLAVSEFENGLVNIAIHDLERGSKTMLPMQGVNYSPVWSPDSRELLFATSLNGPFDVYRHEVNGGIEPHVVVADQPDQVPTSWSADGRWIIWHDSRGMQVALDLQGDGTPVELSLGETDSAAISPDTKWIADHKVLSGRYEIVVRRFPEADREFQVSVGGGSFPHWGEGDRELLYRRGNSVMAVELTFEGDRVVAGRPRELFRGDHTYEQDRADWSYDRTRDELIMIRNGENEVRNDRFVVALHALD